MRRIGVLMAALAGCGTRTTADVPRAEIYLECEVASDGITTTVALRSNPRLAEEDAFLLRTEAGDSRLSPYPWETAGKGPHPVDRHSFTAKLPPVRSVSVGLRHQGSDRWSDVWLPPAPNLSHAPGDIPALVWEGAKDRHVVLHAACAGDADPDNVANLSLPDIGRVDVKKVFDEAELKKPVLKQCDELTIVVSRLSEQTMVPLGASRFASCAVEQLRSARIKRPEPPGGADANPSP